MGISQDSDYPLAPHTLSPSAFPTGMERVTIWNRADHRKIAGNAAPLAKNLAGYLAKHPSCEVYRGQDKMVEVRGLGHQRLIAPMASISTVRSMTAAATVMSTVTNSATQATSPSETVDTCCNMGQPHYQQQELDGLLNDNQHEHKHFSQNTNPVMFSNFPIQHINQQALLNPLNFPNNIPAPQNQEQQALLQYYLYMQQQNTLLLQQQNQQQQQQQQQVQLLLQQQQQQQQQQKQQQQQQQQQEQQQQQQIPLQQQSQQRNDIHHIDNTQNPSLIRTFLSDINHKKNMDGNANRIHQHHKNESRPQFSKCTAAPLSFMDKLNDQEYRMISDGVSTSLRTGQGQVPSTTNLVGEDKVKIQDRQDRTNSRFYYTSSLYGNNFTGESLGSGPGAATQARTGIFNTNTTLETAKNHNNSVLNHTDQNYNVRESSSLMPNSLSQFLHGSVDFNNNYNNNKKTLPSLSSAEFLKFGRISQAPSMDFFDGASMDVDINFGSALKGNSNGLFSNLPANSYFRKNSRSNSNYSLLLMSANNNTTNDGGGKEAEPLMAESSTDFRKYKELSFSMEFGTPKLGATPGQDYNYLSSRFSSFASNLQADVNFGLGAFDVPAMENQPPELISCQATDTGHSDANNRQGGMARSTSNDFSSLEQVAVMNATLFGSRPQTGVTNIKRSNSSMDDLRFCPF